MSARAPERNASSASCAIVGGGLGGLVAYTTLRHGGLGPEEIDVFGLDPDPASAWRERAAAIRQRRMRSESDGHCFATSFPGLAVRAALRQRAVRPLLESVCDRYHPSVEEFLEHVQDVRVRSRWDESLQRARVARVLAVDGGFSLDGFGAYAHVLLAPGHAGLALPSELEGDRRVVHSYQPHGYADDVVIVGAGMAAATEWLNALAAGARVVSVRRREPTRRPLNVERHYFSRRGLTRFHGTAREERVALLHRFLAPSYPPGREWDEPLARATAEGRFRVERALNGAEQVICATGFRHGYAHDALLALLAEEHELETAGGWIVLAPDSTVAELTDEDRTLSLAGAPAQWAYPAADTLVGMKYAARCFLERVRRWRTR